MFIYYQLSIHPGSCVYRSVAMQSDFQAIEVLNIAAKDKYVDMSKTAQKLLSHTNVLHHNYEHLDGRIRQISDLERSVTQLETLVTELTAHLKRVQIYLNSTQ
ncbi:hypothetical protein MT418_001589 [Batrachochytrium dendrobatidis]